MITNDNQAESTRRSRGCSQPESLSNWIAICFWNKLLGDSVWLPKPQSMIQLQRHYKFLGWHSDCAFQDPTRTENCEGEREQREQFIASDSLYPVYPPPQNHPGGEPAWMRLPAHSRPPRRPSLDLGRGVPFFEPTLIYALSWHKVIQRHDLPNTAVP